MADSQPPTITCHGPEIFGALERIDRAGGRVTVIAMGKTNSQWVLSVNWRPGGMISFEQALANASRAGS